MLLKSALKVVVVNPTFYPYYGHSPWPVICQVIN